MSSRYLETISGYNQFIDELREEAAENTFVTLVQFDTRKTAVYEQLALADVPELDENSYVLGGMTALYDGVGELIRRMEKFVKPGDNVAVTIMTDGEENSSTKFTQHSVAALMDKKREEGWEFNYLGAGPQAWSGAQALRIHDSHTINYGADAGSHELAFAALASSNVAKTRGLSSSYVTAAPQVKSRLEAETGIPVQVDGRLVLDGQVRKARRTRRSS
jgi:hypothetical protein